MVVATARRSPLWANRSTPSFLRQSLPLAGTWHLTDCRYVRYFEVGVPHGTMGCGSKCDVHGNQQGRGYHGPRVRRQSVTMVPGKALFITEPQFTPLSPHPLFCNPFSHDE